MIIASSTSPRIKNSTFNTTNGRYVLGGVTETSAFALEMWDKNTLSPDPSDIVYFVEKKYENKPHLLGYVFYGDTGLWWVICQYNGILDPISEIIEGKLLLIPLKDRISTMSSNQSNVGGIQSTRVKGI